MRIIAGARRGKKLFQKIDETTRPTTDRVRESVFNVLSNLIDIRGTKVLDLFAGCGAYGLESYSRGAEEIIFNDSDRKACDVIRLNCKSVGCDAVSLRGAFAEQSGRSNPYPDKSVISNLDFRAALENLKNQRFDIIFLDPPYASDFAMQALDVIQKQNMLAENGVIVIETERELPIKFTRVKRYGRALLYFLGHSSQLPQ